MDSRLDKLIRIARDVVVPIVRNAARDAGGKDTAAGRSPSRRAGAGRIRMPSLRRPRTPAPSDRSRDARRGEVDTATARPLIAYSPARDDDADPGEIVWAYVPYEDDPTKGKDRPLLVIGHIDDDVAALGLTSREHDDRHHHPLGAGPWDRNGRPSWVKLDRLLRLDPDAIRREGAVLDRERFDSVVAAWKAY